MEINNSRAKIREKIWYLPERQACGSGFYRNVTEIDAEAFVELLLRLLIIQVFG